ncbi:MAG: TetR/AcrR family transcriptional regulator [Myxococcota bacterium]|nr:TetR/AcrR family transcriptional regulator [Myxococcota bacterium]
MTARRSPARARPRRTHAERTAETRGRILAAVVESIEAVGFQRTTASEIAKRAGVTWGAVQHHFGGKDGILNAVLQQSFDRFAREFRDPPAADAPLEERVHFFVECAWRHFGSPHFRSTLEILLHYAAPEPGSNPEASWQGEMLGRWNGIWSRLFPDAHMGSRRRVALQHYTISVLAGLASMQRLEGGGSARHTMELEWLERTLLSEIGAGGDANA